MENWEWCQLLASTPISGGAALNEWSRERGDLRSRDRMAADFYKPHDPGSQRSSEEGDLGVAASASNSHNAMAAEFGGDYGSDEAELCVEVAAPAVGDSSLLSPRGVFGGTSDIDKSGVGYTAGGSSGPPMNGATAANMRSLPQLSDVLHAADPSMLNDVPELPNYRKQQLLLQQQQLQQRGLRQKLSGHRDGDLERNGIRKLAEVPPSPDLGWLDLWGAIDAYPLPVLPNQRPFTGLMPSSPSSLLPSAAAATADAYAALPSSNVKSAAGRGGGHGKSGGLSPLSPFGLIESSLAPSGMKVVGSSPAPSPLGLSWSMPAQSGNKVVGQPQQQQEQQQQQQQQRKRTWEEASGARSTPESGTIAVVSAVAPTSVTGRDEHQEPRSVNNNVENDDKLDWQPLTMRKALWNGRDGGCRSSDGGRARSCGGGGSRHKIKAKSMTERQRRDRISDALTQLRMTVNGHGDMASMINHTVNTLHTLQQTNKQLELQLLQHRLLCSCDATNAPLHCHHL